MTRRKHETREVWAERVSAWRANGLSGGKYARRHSLKESTLYRWGKILGEEKPRKRVQRFSRVVVSTPSVEAAVVEVVLRTGRIVRVRGPVDPAQLQAVVAALESC